LTHGWKNADGWRAVEGCGGVGIKGDGVQRRWSYPGGFTEAKKSVRARSTAVWLRGAILQLGPTFIKLGQLFRSNLHAAHAVHCECNLVSLHCGSFPKKPPDALLNDRWVVHCSTRSDLLPREFTEELSQLQVRPRNRPVCWLQ
jgi:hypothetical protein